MSHILKYFRVFLFVF